MKAWTFEDMDRLVETVRANPDALLMPDVAGRDSVRTAIHKRIASGPVFRQYINHLDSSKRGMLPRNRFAWHAEGERQYAAAMIAMVGQPGGPKMQSLGGDTFADDLALGAAMVILQAQVFLWSEEIEAIANETPLPPHIISRDVLPFPLMFWSREVAHVSEQGETNWLFIMHHADGIRCIADLTRSSDDCTMLVGDIPYGAKYPDDFSDDPSYQGVTAFLGRLAFLASPYIVPTEEHLPRAWRREAQRNGALASIADPLIRVVRLRRDAQENVDRQRQDAASGVERKSHWWVSGHFRAQWYPSKEAHEVIWIAPYLKGDLAKPLAEKIYKVVR